MSAATDRPLVVVTGAAGGIGRALCSALAPRHTVVGLDRHCGGVDFECVEFDLTERESVDRALARIAARHGRRIASVIHLAAYFDFTGEENPLYDKVNVQGTRTLLDALAAYDVEQLVYSGTMLVHRAARPGEVIDESAPVEPKWAYPESKAAAERVIREHRGPIKTVRLHLAGLYDDQKVVPTLAHQFARIHQRDVKSRLYSGDTRAGQSMVHVDDMVDAFVRAVDRRAELPDDVAILVGEPDGVPYDELQDRIGRLVHGERGWRTLTVPKPVAKAGAWAEEKAEPVVPDLIDHGEKPFIRPFMVDMANDHYALDVRRARELLGWEPRHDIRDALPRIVAALERDPAAWYDAHGITPPHWVVQGRARPFRWIRHGLAALGVALLLAPLVTWTESPSWYALATLAGAALFAAGVWPSPALPERAVGDPDRRSPSSWGPRIVIACLALVAFGFAYYMASFQLGHVAGLWDPWFGDGSERVTSSWISEAFPVSDAGLGAAAYLLEAVLALAGDTQRWRTRPWLVALFTFLVVPVGAVSFAFIAMQPLLLGVWCGLCIVTAAATALMIPFAVPEMLAAWRRLIASGRA